MKLDEKRFFSEYVTMDGRWYRYMEQMTYKDALKAGKARKRCRQCSDYRVTEGEFQLDYDALLDIGDRLLGTAQCAVEFRPILGLNLDALYSPESIKRSVDRKRQQRRNKDV